MPNVVIVDDHKIVAEGLARYLEATDKFRVQAICTSGEELLTLLRKGDAPDVCILDLHMPGIGGVDLIRTVTEKYPHTKILVCSGAALPEVAARCLREGANGFISKTSSGDVFVLAIEVALKNGRFIEPALFNDVVSYMSNIPAEGTAFENLSTREYAVLIKLAGGMTVQDIATEMNLHVKTISTYRARVLSKLSLRTNAELTAYCVKRKLVTFEESASDPSDGVNS